MRERLPQKEREYGSFESRVRAKIKELEDSSVESFFGKNTSSSEYEFQTGGRRVMEELAQWISSFFESPERGSLLDLPWKELLDMYRFESRWSHQPSQGRLIQEILTQHEAWLPYLTAFGQSGLQLDQWIREEPAVLEQLRTTMVVYRTFSDSLTQNTEPFFQPGKSPGDSYRQKHLPNATDEAVAYRITSQGAYENRRLSQPAKDEYWDKIEAAIQKKDLKALARLSQEMQSQTTLFNKLFSAAVRSEHTIELKDIQGVQVEKLRAADLTQQDQTQMGQIIEQNWAQYPDLVASMLTGLHATHKQGTFFLLKKHGEIIAFLQASPYKSSKEQGVWLGMLNVDPRYRGHAVATVFTKEMVNVLGNYHSLYADVFPFVEAGTMYVKRLGFQIMGISDPKATGDSAQQRLLLRREPTNEPGIQNVTRTQREAFRIPEDSALMIRIVSKLTHEGMIGTHYEIDSKDPSIRWITFAKMAERKDAKQDALKHAA